MVVTVSAALCILEVADFLRLVMLLYFLSKSLSHPPLQQCLLRLGVIFLHLWVNVVLLYHNSPEKLDLYETLNYTPIAAGAAAVIDEENTNV